MDWNVMLGIFGELWKNNICVIKKSRCFIFVATGFFNCKTYSPKISLGVFIIAFFKKGFLISSFFKDSSLKEFL